MSNACQDDVQEGGSSPSNSPFSSQHSPTSKDHNTLDGGLEEESGRRESRISFAKANTTGDLPLSRESSSKDGGSISSPLSSPRSGGMQSPSNKRRSIGEEKLDPHNVSGGICHHSNLEIQINFCYRKSITAQD